MKTIVFYSYKGGTGRSLLLANYARYLALCGKRIFILDCDLEAPGLHHKFEASGLLAPGSSPLLGLADYIPKSDADSTGLPLQLLVPESLDEYVAELTIGDPETVYFMPAGRSPEPNYARTVLNIEWKQLFPLWDAPAIGVPLFGDLKERIAERYKPDFLLIDSRTGITDIGSVVVRHLADSFVCVFLNNPENIAGTRAIVRSLRQRPAESTSPQPRILPVFARATEASHEQEEEMIGRVRAELGPDLDGLPLYLLHEEQSLHIAEELLFGSSRALGDSTLLRDYLRLFVALDPETAALSKYASLQSYLALLDNTVTEHHVDATHPRVKILSEIARRDPKILRHAGKHPGKASSDKYSASGYGYVAGRAYGDLASSILRDLLERVESRVVGLASAEEPVVESDINWDLLGLQIGTRFDFSSEPYFLTDYRSLFLDVVPLGRLKTFTCFVRRDSVIYAAIAQASAPGDVGRAVQAAKEVDEAIQVCVMGESAAADEATKAISPFIHGSALHFQRDAEGLRNWLLSSDSSPAHKLIICDHSVAGKIANLTGKPDEYVYSRQGKDHPEMTFNCRESILTGLLFPAGDREWRYLLNQAVAASVSRETWGDIHTQDSVALDLSEAGIEPLSWDQLVTSLVLGMNPNDAQAWLQDASLPSLNNRSQP